MKDRWITLARCLIKVKLPFNTYFIATENKENDKQKVEKEKKKEREHRSNDQHSFENTNLTSFLVPLAHYVPPGIFCEEVQTVKKVSE